MRKKCVVCRKMRKTTVTAGYYICKQCMDSAPSCGSLTQYVNFPNRGLCKNKANYYPRLGWRPCKECDSTLQGVSTD